MQMGLCGENYSINLVIVSFFKEDEWINSFLTTFRICLEKLNLRDTTRTEDKFDKINEASKHLRNIKDNNLYNSLMLLTRTDVDNGTPRYQETVDDPRNMDGLVENWLFFVENLCDAGNGCLGILIVPYFFVNNEVRDLLENKGGFSNFISPYHGKIFESEVLAKAISSFIYSANRFGGIEYSPISLEKALKEVNKKHPEVLQLLF